MRNLCAVLSFVATALPACDRKVDGFREKHAADWSYLEICAEELVERAEKAKQKHEDSFYGRQFPGLLESFRGDPAEAEKLLAEIAPFLKDMKEMYRNFWEGWCRERIRVVYHVPYHIYTDSHLEKFQAYMMIIVDEEAELPATDYGPDDYDNAFLNIGRAIPSRENPPQRWRNGSAAAQHLPIDPWYRLASTFGCLSDRRRPVRRS